MEGDHNPSAFKWTYIIFPLIGGILAGFANKKHIELLSTNGALPEE